jgi:hypothetical protein
MKQRCHIASVQPRSGVAAQQFQMKRELRSRAALRRENPACAVQGESNMQQVVDFLSLSLRW